MDVCTKLYGSPVGVEIFNSKPQYQPHGGAKGKVRGSSRVLGLLVWGSSIYPPDVEIFDLLGADVSSHFLISYVDANVVLSVPRLKPNLPPPLPNMQSL